MKTRMFLTILVVLGMGGLAEASIIDSASGLLYHLDASVAGSITTNSNGKVTGWADQSTNHYDFTNASSPSATYVSSDSNFNNLPAVQFNNAYNALAMGLSTSPKTVIVVNLTTSTSGDVDGMWGLTATDFGIRRHWTSTPGTDWWLTQNNGGGVGNDFASSSNMYVNGAQSYVQAIGTPGILEAYGSKTLSTTSLGGYFGGVRCWTGQLAEIAVFNVDLSLPQYASERAAIMSYLGAKYNILTPYPVPEPGTVVLLLSGLLGLLAYAWRKRR